MYAGYVIAGMLLVMSIAATLYGRMQHITTLAHLHAWGLGIVVVGVVVWAMAHGHLAGLICRFEYFAPQFNELANVPLHPSPTRLKSLFGLLSANFLPIDYLAGFKLMGL